VAFLGLPIDIDIIILGLVEVGGMLAVAANELWENVQSV
jgi:hypothetical protein